ncbi:MAG TPA: hypothetical protein VK577_04770 [Bradyrhizobium sp.]|jgi:hypothetical protein|nr:hypothetical protein [Bradyrhizobium sp.]HMH95877.1 hypothetical protein [Bradyrhizobium sp.]
MRIGVIVVSMLVLTTSSSEASKSCMTKTEARQHFGSVHIYWHGNDHCWDATPTRRHGRIHTVRQKDHLDTVQQTVQQKIRQPSWHDSMSEMLPDEASVRTPWVAPPEAPVRTPWAAPQVDIEPPQLSMAERWVDIAQVAQPRIIRKPQPMVTPRGVVMVIIFITLTLAIVMIFEHPRSRRNTPAAG